MLEQSSASHTYILSFLLHDRIAKEIFVLVCSGPASFEDHILHAFSVYVRMPYNSMMACQVPYPMEESTFLQIPFCHSTRQLDW
jgi:hypothetical protein